MDYHATLISIQRTSENQYEAKFAYDGNAYIKHFVVPKNKGYDEISINDEDLEPELVLSDDTTRALFAFHRAFREPNIVEKRSLTYRSRILPEILAREEKEKLSLPEQTHEQPSVGPQEHIATNEKYGKKILVDPDTRQPLY